MKGHISSDCTLKQTKPRNEWWINKQIQNFTHQNEDNVTNSIRTIATTTSSNINNNNNESGNDGNTNNNNTSGVNSAQQSNFMEQNNFSQINLNQNHITQEDLQKVILLDTASTVDLACNRKLGDNIEKAPIKMKLNLMQEIK